MKTFVACLVAVSLAGASFAQVSKVGAGYQFRRSLKSGEVAKFVVSERSSNEGTSFPERVMPITFKVNSVKSGTGLGVYELGSLARNVRKLPFEINSLNITNAANPLWHLGDLQFPKNAIAPGKTWTQTVAHPAFTTTLPLGIQFIGVKKLASISIAELKVSLTKTTDSGVISGTGIARIRVSDGSWESLSWSESVSRYDRDNSFKTLRSNKELKVSRKAK